VSIKLETLAEWTKAVLTTLVGSTIPLSLRLTYVPFAELNPFSMFPSSRSLAAMRFPSKPAFWQIVIAGILMAF
jgi:hypothetical protein